MNGIFHSQYDIIYNNIIQYYICEWNTLKMRVIQIFLSNYCSIIKKQKIIPALRIAPELLNIPINKTSLGLSVNEWNSEQ